MACDARLQLPRASQTSLSLGRSQHKGRWRRFLGFGTRNRPPPKIHPVLFKWLIRSNRNTMRALIGSIHCENQCRRTFLLADVSVLGIIIACLFARPLPPQIQPDFI